MLKGLYCRIKAYLQVEPGSAGGVLSVGEVFLKDHSPYLVEFQRKPRRNSERLGRQARRGNEPVTSRLPVLRAESLGHWQGVLKGLSKIYCQEVWIRYYEFILCISYWDAIWNFFSNIDNFIGRCGWKFFEFFN